MISLFTYFALVCSGNDVQKVIVASQAVVDSRPVPGCRWIETTEDGSKGKNYAGKGYKYDDTLTAFIHPKPYNSWNLDLESAVWVPPSQKPKDGKHYNWDESSLTWKEDKFKATIK